MHTLHTLDSRQILETHIYRYKLIARWKILQLQCSSDVDFFIQADIACHDDNWIKCNVALHVLFLTASISVVDIEDWVAKQTPMPVTVRVLLKRRHRHEAYVVQQLTCFFRQSFLLRCWSLCLVYIPLYLQLNARHTVQHIKPWNNIKPTEIPAIRICCQNKH